MRQTRNILMIASRTSSTGIKTYIVVIDRGTKQGLKQIQILTSKGFKIVTEGMRVTTLEKTCGVQA